MINLHGKAEEWRLLAEQDPNKCLCQIRNEIAMVDEEELQDYSSALKLLILARLSDADGEILKALIDSNWGRGLAREVVESPEYAACKSRKRQLQEAIKRMQKKELELADDRKKLTTLQAEERQLAAEIEKIKTELARLDSEEQDTGKKK